MPISANALFHFTDNLEHIVNILTNEFIPHFCPEDLTFLAPKRNVVPPLRFMIPMISFCDIPLSQVTNHMKVYGQYAIGMRRPWGRAHKIAPVIYVERGSAIAKALYSLLASAAELPDDHPRRSARRRLLHQFASFTKPYEGPFRHHGRNFRNHKFYDEREWRFVPRSAWSLRDYREDGTPFTMEKQRDTGRIVIRQSRLRFAPREVKYVVVSSEEEIPSIIQHIETAKTRHGRNEVRLLVSRVLSAEQILEDF